jgi:hypothetical protein
LWPLWPLLPLLEWKRPPRPPRCFLSSAGVGVLINSVRYITMRHRVIATHPAIPPVSPIHAMTWLSLGRLLGLRLLRWRLGYLLRVAVAPCERHLGNALHQVLGKYPNSWTILEGENPRISR